MNAQTCHIQRILEIGVDTRISVVYWMQWIFGRKLSFQARKTQWCWIYSDWSRSGISILVIRHLIALGIKHVVKVPDTRQQLQPNCLTDIHTSTNHPSDRLKYMWCRLCNYSEGTLGERIVTILGWAMMSEYSFSFLPSSVSLIVQCRIEVIVIRTLLDCDKGLRPAF